MVTECSRWILKHSHCMCIYCQLSLSVCVCQFNHSSSFHVVNIQRAPLSGLWHEYMVARSFLEVWFDAMFDQMQGSAQPSIAHPPLATVACTVLVLPLLYQELNKSQNEVHVSSNGGYSSKKARHGESYERFADRAPSGLHVLINLVTSPHAHRPPMHRVGVCHGMCRDDVASSVPCSRMYLCQCIAYCMTCTGSQEAQTPDEKSQYDGLGRFAKSC